MGGRDCGFGLALWGSGVGLAHLQYYCGFVAARGDVVG